jgi:hypothetical protein
MNTITTQNKSKNLDIYFISICLYITIQCFRLQNVVGSEIASSADEITVTTEVNQKALENLLIFVLWFHGFKTRS